MNKDESYMMLLDIMKEVINNPQDPHKILTTLIPACSLYLKKADEYQRNLQKQE